jgi:hypothetical protein
LSDSVSVCLCMSVFACLWVCACVFEFGPDCVFLCPCGK